MSGLDSEKKAGQRLLLVYCLFILYGSFIPFHFNFDPNFVRWRWTIFLTEGIQGRIAGASLSDGISNIALFIPFGFLCAWLAAANAKHRYAPLTTLLTGVHGLLFGLAIESGQTLSPWRSPSLLDALFNGTGAFIGAVTGLILLPAFRGSLKTDLIHALRNQPSWLLVSYLMLGLFVDSYFPFDVTLDVSTIWHNLKGSQLIPLRVTHRYWFELFIERGVVFVAIGYFVLSNIQRRRRTNAAGLTWLLCSTVGCAIEIGKLFFLGRVFYLENIIMASFGTLLGVIVLPSLSALTSVKRHRETIWFMLMLGFLVYFELSPFDWISLSELSARFSFIEWLPFKSYYYSEPLMALFDLQKKIYSLIPLGFIAMSLAPSQHAAAPRRKAMRLCIAIVVSLEMTQLLVRSRTPSTTDMITLSLGSWIGILLFEAYQSFKDDKENGRVGVQSHGDCLFDRGD